MYQAVYSKKDFIEAENTLISGAASIRGGNILKLRFNSLRKAYKLLGISNIFGELFQLNIPRRNTIGGQCYVLCRR